MKRLIITLLVSLIVITSYSAVISKETAILTASNHIYATQQDVINTAVWGQDKDAQIYIINFEPEGWALVSSNDNARPIIGYSPKGSFDIDQLGSNIESWLNLQLDIVKSSTDNNIWKAEWDYLKTGPLPVLKSSSSVEPLLAVEWDQGRGWNDLCPPYAEGPNGKAYVGCVAVAMAQSMHHIQYPDYPVGNKSYALAPYGSISTNFDDEPAYEWSEMSNTSPDDYNRQLLYNCAVAVEMDFGGDGSGAYTTRVPFAFKRYFQFGSEVLCVERNDYTTEKEWTDILKDELRNNRVIIYSGNPGTGVAGHAFNIDGFTSSGYFHFNWGWSGSLNGYFTINNVAPGSHDFKANQKAVIGIAKPYWGPTNIELSKLTVLADQPEGTFVADITVTDDSESDEFSFEIKGAPLFLEEGYAEAKFYIENMQLKTKEVLQLSSYPEVATIIVTDSENLSYEKSFNITVTKSSSINSNKESSLNVYPNPATDQIFIDDLQMQHLHIIDLSGKVQYSSSENANSVDVSQLKRGTYILQITLKNGGTSLHKIILN